MHRALFVVLAIVGTPAQAAIFNSAAAYTDVKEKLLAEDTRALADSAFDAMFRRAAMLLRSQGYHKTASDLMGEWNEIYKSSLLHNDNVGDHAPLSVWVAAWYEAIKLLLGDDVMAASHLRDIWLLNFTIPTVFNPHKFSTWCQATEAAKVTDSCMMEYQRQFTSFAPLVTYWRIFVDCETALRGVNVSLTCGLMASACEIELGRRAARDISAAIWRKRNPESAAATPQIPYKSR